MNTHANGGLKEPADDKSKLVLMYGLAALSATVVLFSMIYILVVGVRMTARHAPQIDAAMEIKLELTRAHLWFEQIISGDKAKDMTEVWRLIDCADWYAQALLEGGESEEGKFLPLKDDQLRGSVQEIQSQLAEFRRMTRVRHETPAESGIGSEMDQKYDKVYEQLMLKADTMETAFQNRITADLGRFRLVQIALIVLGAGLFITVAVVFDFFIRRHLRDVKQLRATNQQLTASEQQLRASNQQLTASEQQLRASNQQLTASEQQLRASNQQLRANEQEIEKLSRFPSENRSPVLRVGEEGVLLYANPASEELLLDWGCQVGQAVGEWWRQRVSEALESGSEKQVELEHAGRTYSFAIVPVAEAGYANLYGRDITERKRAEEIINESEQRFRDFFEKTPIGLHIFGPDQTITDINDAELDMIGYSREEIVGKKKWQDIVISAQREKFQKHWHDIITKGRIRDLEYTLVHKQGYHIDVILNASSRFDENGNLINTRGSVLNITERKKAEEQIHNLAKFPSENPNPVLRIAKNGRLLYANDASRAILDAWQCEPGQTVPEQWQEILSEVFATGAEKRVEEEHAGKAFSFSVTPVGEAGYANIYGRDITDRKRIQRQREQLMTSLEAKNRELQRFSSIVRHDFANPLLSIQGFTRELAEAVEMLGRLLQDENIQEPLRDRACALLDDEIGTAVGFILKATDEMTKLLDGLRQIAAAGQVDINIEALDMSELIRQITGAMKFQIEESGASVQIGQLPPCCGDWAQIKQAFTNLLTNAIKYLEPGRPGQIQVCGNMEEDRVVYCVEDNGIGIPPAHQDKIFDMFHRVGAKEDITGEGLGLSIVGRIIDRHHGSISVDSQPGKGSRFYVTLPAVLELAATHTNHATPNQKQG